MILLSEHFVLPDFVNLCVEFFAPFAVLELSLCDDNGLSVTILRPGADDLRSLCQNNPVGGDACEVSRLRLDPPREKP